MASAVLIAAVTMSTTRRLAASLLALTLATGVADAQPGPPPPLHKDRNVALALSLGGVLGSGALMLVGRTSNNDALVAVGATSLAVTPSLGAWYAGQGFTWGMALRAGGVGVGLLAFGTAIAHLFDNSYNSTISTELIIGGALFASGVVYDVVDAPFAADRFNARHHITMAPTVMVTPSGTVPAIGIGGTF